MLDTSPGQLALFDGPPLLPALVEPPPLAPTADRDAVDVCLVPQWTPTYYVPEARTFGDLFPKQVFGRDCTKQPCRRPLRSCYVVDHRPERGEDDPHVWWFDVYLSAAVDALVQSMDRLVGDQGVYAEVIIREDGSCLAVMKYDQIIGSRWLAEIDQATVPRPPRAPAHRRAALPPKPAGSAAVAPADRKTRLAELLGLMRVDGDLARFTGGAIDDWALLKGAMQGLGGRWVGGKTQGFRFGKRVDVAAVIAAAIATGKITNEAREADFVASPPPVAERVVELAAIRPNDRVLEPSAGRGAIADAVLAAEPKVDLVLCELLEDNRDALVAKGHGEALTEERDFMRADLGDFDVVVMNPPFKDEIVHVTRAYGMLRPGGRLVSVMSGGILFRQDARTTAFREWVTAQGGAIEELPSGSFRESGTDVSTVIVCLRQSGGAS